MSGGHFGHSHYCISDTADEMAECIAEYKSEYSEDTIKVLEETERLLRQVSIMLHRVDWLVSGDDGEETFHKRLKEELNSDIL